MQPDWKGFLVAVVAGNLLYFGLLPYLPPFLQHEAFQLDLGLGLDFLLCVAAYLGWRRWILKRTP